MKAVLFLPAPRKSTAKMVRNNRDNSSRSEGYLQDPIQPFQPAQVTTVEDALVRLARCSFQGRNLGRALEILWAMVSEEKCLKVLALAGAMVPAGMGEVVCTMIEQGLVDVIVSTAANITHDLVNAFVGGQGHYQGSPHADDEALFDEKINRIYDVLLPDEHYDEARAREFETLKRFYGSNHAIDFPSHMFHVLGKAAPHRCFLRVAARHEVPVFCGATSDSDLGMMIGEMRNEDKLDLILDELGDVINFAELVQQYPRAGTIIVGGGVPRNWTQQVFPFLEKPNAPRPPEGLGYDYSVRISTATEYDGGLSGCTLSENKSWGKYRKSARHVSVWMDATVALPLLVTAVLQRKARLAAE